MSGEQSLDAPLAALGFGAEGELAVDDCAAKATLSVVVRVGCRAVVFSEAPERGPGL